MATLFREERPNAYSEPLEPTAAYSSPRPERVLACGVADIRIELWGGHPSPFETHYVAHGCDADAFRFHLETCPAIAVHADEVPTWLPACAESWCSMLDYGPRIAWSGSVPRMIVFRIPRNSMAGWAHANGHTSFSGLAYQSGVPFENAILANLAIAMHRSLTSQHAAAPAFTDMIAEAMLTYLVKFFGQSAAPQTKGGLAAWQMRAVERLVETRMHGELKLGELASVCGLSKSYFVTAFRVATGLTPHQWVISRRIERAREKLRTPDISLADVAIGCGFADQSHFTRTFTRITGVSPGAWRKQVAYVERAAALSIGRVPKAAMN